MQIVYSRTVTVSLPRGAVGHLRAIQTEVEEHFSSKEHFMDWYDDNHSCKINRAVPPKFVSAVCDGKTRCCYTDTDKAQVFYFVVT